MIQEYSIHGEETDLCILRFVSGKLSVGIALLGDSKIVFLDESVMNSWSAGCIWVSVLIYIIFFVSHLLGRLLVWILILVARHGIC